MTRKHAFLALAVTAAAFAWQWLTVHYNYGGQWTALFCIATDYKPPAFLAHESPYVFPSSLGYDGMQYHIVAHDPWMLRGGRTAVDNATRRYTRILVPALAWLLAFGRDEWIHASYAAVILAFLFLGTYWLSALVERFGLHPAWGCAFALTPAVLTSIDRLTVDVALAALCCGFALYVDTADRWKAVAILGLALLSRETALALVAGYAAYLISQRDFRGVAGVAVAAAPGAAWVMLLIAQTGSIPAHGMGGVIPFLGLVDRVFHPEPYPLPAWQSAIAHALDWVALMGIALSLIWIALLARRRLWSPTVCALYFLGLATVFMQHASVWEDAFSFGRVLTPALLLGSIEALRAGKIWWALAPVLCIDARIALNFAKQTIGVVQGIF